MVLTACGAVAPGIKIGSAPTAPASGSAPAAEQPAASNLNAEGHPGPTTADAKVAIDLDVQRLDEEQSAFVWRGAPATHSATCASGWLCTLTLVDGSIKLYQGDGSSYVITAGTFRKVSAFDANDAVHTPCDLLVKEQGFGNRENPSFPVAGNFTCAGNTGNSSATLSCPIFGGVQTVAGNDGSAFCKYKGSVISATVPSGFKAEYWDGSAVQNAASGTSIKTGEATFRPQ